MKSSNNPRLKDRIFIIIIGLLLIITIGIDSCELDDRISFEEKVEKNICTPDNYAIDCGNCERLCIEEGYPEGISWYPFNDEWCHCGDHIYRDRHNMFRLNETK